MTAGSETSVIAVAVSCWPDEIAFQPTINPTINAIETAMMIVARLSAILNSADHHTSDLQCRRSDGSEEGYVVSDHFKVAKHFQEISCNRHFLDRMNELSVLDQNSDGAPRVVARYGVHA